MNTLALGLAIVVFVTGCIILSRTTSSSAKVEAILFWSGLFALGTYIIINSIIPK